MNLIVMVDRKEREKSSENIMNVNKDQSSDNRPNKMIIR